MLLSIGAPASVSDNIGIKDFDKLKSSGNCASRSQVHNGHKPAAFRRWQKKLWAWQGPVQLFIVSIIGCASSVIMK
jgi:hypothetical protein